MKKMNESEINLTRWKVRREVQARQKWTPYLFGGQRGLDDLRKK